MCRILLTPKLISRVFHIIPLNNLNHNHPYLLQSYECLSDKYSNMPYSNSVNEIITRNNKRKQDSSKILDHWYSWGSKVTQDKIFPNSKTSSWPWFADRNWEILQKMNDFYLITTESSYRKAASGSWQISMRNMSIQWQLTALSSRSMHLLKCGI